MEKQIRKGIELSERDARIFWVYAGPCAKEVLVRMKIGTLEDVDRLIENISQGSLPADHLEDKFLVAMSMCRMLARDRGKEVIDADIIREYFLVRHGTMVDARAEFKEKDFDPVECKTYIGRVIAVNDGSALVETGIGRKDYNTAFVPGIKEGATVSVHLGFIAEEVSPETVEKINSMALLYGARFGPR